MRSVENGECKRYGVWKMRSCNCNCGNCRVNKMMSVKNAAGV